MYNMCVRLCYIYNCGYVCVNVFVSNKPTNQLILVPVPNHDMARYSSKLCSTLCTITISQLQQYVTSTIRCHWAWLFSRHHHFSHAVAIEGLRQLKSCTSMSTRPFLRYWPNVAMLIVWPAYRKFGIILRLWCSFVSTWQSRISKARGSAWDVDGCWYRVDNCFGMQFACLIPA